MEPGSRSQDFDQRAAAAGSSGKLPSAGAGSGGLQMQPVSRIGAPGQTEQAAGSAASSPVPPSNQASDSPPVIGRSSVVTAKHHHKGVVALAVLLTCILSAVAVYIYMQAPSDGTSATQGQSESTDTAAREPAESSAPATVDDVEGALQVIDEAVQSIEEVEDLAADDADLSDESLGL